MFTLILNHCKNYFRYFEKVQKSQHRHLDVNIDDNTNIVFTQYKSPLQLKILYIFVKYVFNKVATYRLGTCHFVRKRFLKMS